MNIRGQNEMNIENSYKDICRGDCKEALHFPFSFPTVCATWLDKDKEGHLKLKEELDWDFQWLD